MKKSCPKPLIQSPFIIEDSTPSDWVDAQVVLKAFPMSKRKLQTLRSKKLIPCAPFGGTYFYYMPGILKELEAAARRHSVRK